MEREETSSRRDHGGFTLVEALLTLTASLLVVGAAFTLVIDDSRLYHQQTQIAEMRQNARSAIEFMSRDIVLAGYGMRTMRITAPAILANEPGQYGSASSTAITLWSNTLDVRTGLSDPMPQPSAELKVESTAGFVEGQRILVWDQTGSWDWAIVTHVQAAASHLQHNTTSLSKSYHPDDDTEVAVVDEVVYRLNAGALQLERKQNLDLWLVVAENVEFLRIRYWDETSAELFPVTDEARRAIRRVSLDLRVRTRDPERLSNLFRTYSVRTDVYPRNLPALPSS